MKSTLLSFAIFAAICLIVAPLAHAQTLEFDIIKAGTNAPNHALATEANANQTNSPKDNDGSAESVAKAMSAHIGAFWHTPSDAAGQTMKAIIKTDANGNLLSFIIYGDAPALGISLQVAINDSSPLTPMIGTEYRTFNITFIAE